MSNVFFFKKKNIKLNHLFPKKKFKKNIIINDIKPLHSAKKSDITFFDSVAYKDLASKISAKVCITNSKLEKYLPKEVDKIIVENVLFELAKVLKIFYPEADKDNIDNTLKYPNTKTYKNVNFGNNVLIGKNVIIGKNSQIGSNSVIEQNVKIGENCIIGYGTILRKTLIGDNVIIQDNCKIGQKGFDLYLQM